MKRILCILIALTLVFGSILPVFAASESIVTSFANPSLTNQVSAYQVMITLVNFVTSFSTDWGNWTNLLGDGNSPGTYYSFQDLAQEVHGLWYWLTPRNPDNISATGLGLWDYIWYIAQEVSSMWGGWDSYFSNLTALQVVNTNLSNLKVALSNYYQDQTQFDISTIKQIAHRALVSISDGTYDIWFYGKDNNNEISVVDNKYIWTQGTPLGNIALILSKYTQSFSNVAYDLLKDYNDNLTTWEHSTNTQTSFTPTSLANGLYRYLAYIQSDTSYLGFRLFNDVSNWGYINDYSYWNGNGISTLSNNGIPYVNIVGRGLRVINQQLAYIGRYGFTGYGDTQTLKSLSLNDYTFNPTSLTLGLYTYLKWIQEPVARLAFVHADDNDIAAKRGTASNEQTITNNFLSTSGTAAATASDYAAVASSIGSVKTSLSTGVSSSGVFDVFSRNYEWFSQTTLDNLDTVPDTRKRSNNEYLDNYYRELNDLIVPMSDKEFLDLIEFKDESIYINNEVVENDQPSR